MYNDFEYVSSEVIVAEVKQKLKSYFDSGSISDALIPTYIDNCLRKLRMMVLELKEDILTVENYKAKLPDDFTYMKGAYLCNVVETYYNDIPVKNEYTYYKKVYCNDTCGNEYETFTQVTCETPSVTKRYLEPKPLKIYHGSKAFCTKDCKGLTLNAMDEIRLTKRTISANFETGDIYVQYFTRPEDEYGPMIPEIIEVEEYVKAYLFYQFFEDLYNSVTDESVNIIERKLQFYKNNYHQKHLAALNILKLQSTQQIRDGIEKQRRRFIKHIIG